LLRELVAGQRQIIHLLEQQQRQQPSSLTRQDRVVLARLLPAIAGVFGSELFVTRELFESDAAALKLVLHGLDRKRVGRLLQRGEGQVVDNYVICREGTEQHATLWALRATL
jgi:hypothetical protein